MVKIRIKFSTESVLIIGQQNKSQEKYAHKCEKSAMRQSQVFAQSFGFYNDGSFPFSE
jgi:hypothetical protein